MATPFDKSEQEQNLASYRDTLPPMLWVLYTGCIEQGFTEKQAFDIVLEQVGSIAGGSSE